MSKRRKISCLAIFLILIVLAVYAYSVASNQMSHEEFIQIMTDKGLKISEESENASIIYKQKSTAFIEDEYDFEYYTAKGHKLAHEVYEILLKNFKNLYGDDEGVKMSETRSKDYTYFVINTPDYYFEVTLYKKTVLLTIAHSDHKEEAKKIANSLGY